MCRFKVGDKVRNVSDKDVQDVPIGGIYTVTNITDHGFFNFLDDVGFERERDSDHYELVVDTIELGKKYRVKSGCEDMCLNYKSAKERAAYVIFNNDLKILNATSYTIYDKSGTAIARCSSCLQAEHVEPYQEQHDFCGTTATEAAMQARANLMIDFNGLCISGHGFRIGWLGDTDDTTSINKKGKGIMSMLREIPKRLKRLLDAKLKAMYQLGWVNEELDYTEDGDEELMEVLRDEYQDKLGERAIKQLAELKKLAKEQKN